MEYKTIEVSIVSRTNDQDKKLNELALIGWRIIHVHAMSNGGFLYHFEREQEDKPRTRGNNMFNG